MFNLFFLICTNILTRNPSRFSDLNHRHSYYLCIKQAGRRHWLLLSQTARVSSFVCLIAGFLCLDGSWLMSLSDSPGQISGKCSSRCGISDIVKHIPSFSAFIENFQQIKIGNSKPTMFLDKRFSDYFVQHCFTSLKY